MPCDCFISVTLDGINYTECEEPFKIYSNELAVQAVHPKCGSVKGGTQITLSTNIDEDNEEFLDNLRIGFRARRVGSRSVISGIEKANIESGTKQIRGSMENLS